MKTDSNFVHLLNADDPIEVAKGGISIEVKPVQYKKNRLSKR